MKEEDDDNYDDDKDISSSFELDWDESAHNVASHIKLLIKNNADSKTQNQLMIPTQNTLN